MNRLASAGKGVTWPVVAALTVILGVDVALVLGGQDGSSLLTLLAVLGVGGGLATRGEVRTAEQNDKLEAIHENTNGVLTRRIETAVAKALRVELKRLGWAEAPEHPDPPDK